MTRKFVTLMSLILMCGFIAACSNTFDGAGRDVENAGKWVQDTF